jgi:hypothetical protein
MQSERQTTEELRRGLGANSQIASSVSVQESSRPPDVEGSSHVDAARPVPVSLHSLIRAEVQGLYDSIRRFVLRILPSKAQVFTLILMFLVMLRFRRVFRRK